jgi:hypothetical protein
VRLFTCSRPDTLFERRRELNPKFRRNDLILISRGPYKHQPAEYLESPNSKTHFARLLASDSSLSNVDLEVIITLGSADFGTYPLTPRTKRTSLPMKFPFVVSEGVEIFIGGQRVTAEFMAFNENNEPILKLDSPLVGKAKRQLREPVMVSYVLGSKKDGVFSVERSVAWPSAKSVAFIYKPPSNEVLDSAVDLSGPPTAPTEFKQAEPEETTFREAVLSLWEAKKTAYSGQAAIWKAEGLCPHCGEKGRYSMSVAVCSRHGEY